MELKLCRNIQLDFFVELLRFFELIKKFAHVSALRFINYFNIPVIMLRNFIEYFLLNSAKLLSDSGLYLFPTLLQVDWIS